MGETRIEWADAVWNPVTGCTKVSEGCRNCYAERMANRLAGRCGYPADEPFRVTLHENRLDLPGSWRKPGRVFVNSMGDLFHENVPDHWIDKVFSVMSAFPRRTFMILTKRPQRAIRWFKHIERDDHRDGSVFHLGQGGLIVAHREWPLPNVWIGVSVEDQATADERIPLLVGIPAAVRFVSSEPLLGPVDLSDELMFIDGLGYGIDWVIAGGETGPGARPMHPDWARSLRDKCQAAGVPFFFKGWGEWSPWYAMEDSGCLCGRNHPDGNWCERTYVWGTGPSMGEFHRSVSASVRVGKNSAGRLLDGREWSEFPRVEVGR